jgi:hypothetical protein
MRQHAPQNAAIGYMWLIALVTGWLGNSMMRSTSKVVFCRRHLAHGPSLSDLGFASCGRCGTCARGVESRTSMAYVENEPELLPGCTDSPSFIELGFKLIEPCLRYLIIITVHCATSLLLMDTKESIISRQNLNSAKCSPNVSNDK